MQYTRGMNVKTILVAVDFSDESLAAAEQAIDFARHIGADVTLLHVGPIPSSPSGIPPSMETTVSAYNKVLSEHLAEDRARLQTLADRLSAGGPQVSHMVIDGFADRGICQAADELDVDLIAVGTHGRTGFKRIFLGSVAEKVVRTSHRNVLVARPGAHSKGGYRKVLVGTDFSEIADHAVSAAVDSVAADGTIDVVHTWQLPPMSYTFMAPTKVADELARPIRESLSSTARARGDELIERFARPGVNMSFIDIEAAPSRGIHEHLESGDYDLAVVGSHGRRGFRRWMLGSVAESTVRHAPCSVLVVHPPDQEASDE